MNYRELRRTWENFHRHPELRSNMRSEVKDSWERSYHFGIDPYLRENPYICTQAELKNYREASSFLVEASRPVMNSLLEYVAGSGFVVVLSDANLCLLEVIGDKEALTWAQNARAVEGSLWMEDLVGTNTASIVMSLAKPYYLNGYEHFCLFSHVASSFCSPIIDQGRLVGGLGMIAPYNKGNSHTLGMVVAATMHIKSKIDMKKVENLHEVINDSMSEGLLALDANRSITLMNENCARILKVGGKQTVIGKSIYDLLGNHPENHNFINVITQQRVITDENFSLVIGNESIHCNVTCNPFKSINALDGGVVIVIRERQRINRLVRNYIGGGATLTFDDIVARDARFASTLQTARAAASSTSNVLLMGESGTGKDIIAQAMHNASPRRDNSFLAINCAALPRDLIASELFGYEDGAFTGARKGGNIGKFELADQGTIFLDEIGDMPLYLQASLLRVLEEKKVMRLGGTKLIPVNVRIIAATNKDLEVEIERNRFRHDLFYRLGVIKIVVPPLRNRPEDILELVRIFIEKTCQRFNKPVLSVSKEVMKAFMAYNWPGNVRELQNLVEAAVQLSGGEILTAELINEVAPAILNSRPCSPNSNGYGFSDDLQKIQEALTSCNYRKKEAAAALGISRSTLYRRMKELNIKL